MKKSTKMSLRIALLLCLAGLAIWLVSFIAVGFDITKISTVTYETKTYEVNEDFSNITIKIRTADLRFVQWEKEYSKIVCHEEARMKHTAAVQDGTLMITVKDTRKWYDNIGISFDDAELTVYLPKKQYEALEIKSDIGDVEMPEDFEFETATVETDTGDVDWQASVAGNLTIETDTGETQLNNISCRTFTAKSNTGEIRIKDTVAGFSGTVISQTGDVTFEDSDAVESLYIKTDTGDVTGTLLSGKLFQTETDTGNVDVPATNGYPCAIITDTGDIHIEVIGN